MVNMTNHEVSQYTKKVNVSIVRVAHEFYPKKGGSITHIIELTKKIQPLIKNQLVICPETKEQHRLYDTDFDINIKRVKSQITSNLNIPGTSLLNDFYYSVNIINEIRELINHNYQIDIIHIHSTDLGLFVKLLSKINKIYIPIIIMQHGSLEIGNNKTKTIIMWNIRKLLLKYFKPDYYFQLDDGTLDQNFINTLKSYNIKYKVFSHAIDTNYYYPKELAANRNKFIILSNHTLSPFKRVDLTILAFKKFKELLEHEKVENVVLRIIGSGPMSDELKKMVIDYNLTDNVIFFGEKSIEEVKDEIICADVVVGTSLISNLNRSIQEAMSCGKPVVMFENSNKTELLLHLENSLLVTSGDTDSFAKYLKLLFDNTNLRMQIGKNARNSIIQLRNWDFRLSQELAVYSEIVGS